MVLQDRLGKFDDVGDGNLSQSTKEGLLCWLDQILLCLPVEWFFIVPVCFGCGIMIFFSASSDWIFPEFVAVMVGGLIFLRYRLHFFTPRILCSAIILIGCGWLSTAFHADRAALELGSALSRPMQITGKIENLGLRPNGKIRFSLSSVHIDGAQRPLTILVSVPQKFLDSRNLSDLPGQTLVGLFRLREPPRPVVPGGYDLARSFWFWGIDATGFALGKPNVQKRKSEVTILETVHRITLKTRFLIIEKIRQIDTLRLDERGIALALIAGEKGDIPKTDLDNMRASGLAHLLAISGLHMALVAGGIYGGTRLLMASIPVLALTWPIRKIAACFGLLGGIAYLAISGAGVATERAFIMASIGFIAILLDRRALSIRTIALSALVILSLDPHSLLSPGFQMSFAAASTLIAFYERAWTPCRTWAYERMGETFMKRKPVVIIGFLTGIALTSLVAGTATAPFALYHFHQMAHFGILANILAMPVLTLWVMPLAVISVVSMPLGFEEVTLAAMSWGIRVILYVAEWVAGLPVSHSDYSAMPVSAISLVVISGIIFIGVRGRFCSLGFIPLICAVVLYWLAPLPFLIVEESGKTVLSYDQQDHIVHMSHQTGSQFARKIWFQRLANPEFSNTDRKWRCDTKGCVIKLHHDQNIVHGQDPGSRAEDCRMATILITDYPIERWRGQKKGCSGPDIVIDRYDLWRNGAYAIYDQVSWAQSLDKKIGKWLRTLVTPIFFPATTHQSDKELTDPIAGQVTGPGEDRYVVTHVRGERGDRLWSPDPLN